MVNLTKKIILSAVLILSLVNLFVNTSVYFRTVKEKTYNENFIADYLKTESHSNLNINLIDNNYSILTKRELYPKEAGIRVNLNYILCGCNFNLILIN